MGKQTICWVQKTPHIVYNVIGVSVGVIGQKEVLEFGLWWLEGQGIYTQTAHNLLGVGPSSWGPQPKIGDQMKQTLWLLANTFLFYLISSAHVLIKDVYAQLLLNILYSREFGSKFKIPLWCEPLSDFISLKTHNMIKKFVEWPWIKNLIWTP